jgi:hypothetical protein
VLADDSSILPDYDAIGVGMDLDRPSDCAGDHRVLLLSKRTRQVLETDAGTA